MTEGDLISGCITTLILFALVAGFIGILHWAGVV